MHGMKHRLEAMIASKPTMEIVYDANRFPLSAKCSACSIEMSAGESGNTSAEENLKWLKAHFNLHVVLSHPLRKRKRTTAVVFHGVHQGAVRLLSISKR
jgi:hypothetical protein